MISTSLRKSFAVLGALILAAALLFVFAPDRASADPANAGDLKITVLGYNAPGTDNASNRNAEYVWIKNVSGETKSVAGWKLSDGYGVRVTFTATNLPNLNDNVDLPAGHAVIVYTGSGTDTTPENDRHAIYMNKSGHIYNNTSGETVTLTDDGGTLVDRLSWDAYGINPTP